MPIPRLTERIRCVYVAMEPVAADMDQDAREPIQTVGYGKETPIAGQPSFESLGDMAVFRRGGVLIETTGYVLFRYFDLRRRGIILKISDRLVQIGHLKVDIYIHQLEPVAHYADQNGATMVKAHFKNRAPSRLERGEVC